MDTITNNAYAKINLALDIVGKREEDGYHFVRMIMQTVDLYDTLTYTVSEESGVRLTCSSPDMPPGDDNLIVRAAKAFIDRYDIPHGVDIVLEKRIPTAAGMGGGSADAAVTLLSLNELFEAGAVLDDLLQEGLKLGADVPYCILAHADRRHFPQDKDRVRGTTFLAEGIGEILTPLDAPPACRLVIARPAAHVSTPEIYRAYDESTSGIRERELHDVHDFSGIHSGESPDIDAITEAITEGDLYKFARMCVNVLEPVTKERVPAVEEIINTMLDYGAAHALMSGSGPAVFGMFEDMKDAEKAFEVLRRKGIAPELFITRFVN